MSQTITSATPGCVYEGGTILEILTCGKCGITFGMPEMRVKECRKHSETFYCPNGHPRVYRTSTEDRLREDLKRAEDRRAETRARLDQARASASAQKAAATRARNERNREREKAHAGVCPAPGCKRHFENLERHMETKHPGLVI
jgi:hypothetical protein